MNRTQGKKTDDEKDKDLSYKDPDYQFNNLNGSQVGNETDVDSTDIDKLAIDENSAKTDEQEDDSFGGEHNTDYGGLYKRTGDAVIDQDADNPPAGTAGHPGIDEDTT